jgi:hypothetical protein
VEVNKRLSRLLYAPPQDQWGVDKVKFAASRSANFSSDMGLFDVVIKPLDDVPIIHINGTKEGPERVPSTWETIIIFAQDGIPTFASTNNIERPRQ